MWLDAGRLILDWIARQQQQREAVYELALQTPLYGWSGIINNVLYRQAARNDRRSRSMVDSVVVGLLVHVQWGLLA